MSSLYIFGNWKMSQSLEEAETFVQSWDVQPNPLVEAAVFPSFPHLQSIKTYATQKNIPLKVGAQDCSTQESGAYTSQVSAQMIQELALDYILLGHSECRQAGDNEESLAKKLALVSKTHLIPVFCVGESLAEREGQKLKSRLKQQLSIIQTYKEPFILAYEPVWAIGTGKVATPQEIQEVHDFLHQELQRTPLLGVLYGGSVKPENAAEILALNGVEGLLIGGASLEYESFKKILEIALKTKEST